MVSKEINLLSSLPKSKRDVKTRAKDKSPAVLAIAKRFQYDYFDGDRKYGYGGYKYDGRWVQAAKDIVEFFKLKDGAKILDIGCAKGFLVKDLCDLGMDVYGIDISSYAISVAMPEIKDRLKIGTADNLPIDDNSCDLVISINTLHNLPRDRLIKALQEIERVSRGDSYVVVDSYYVPKQKKEFQDWVLTAETYGYPHQWLKIFEEAGYRGHYSWNLL